MRQSVVGICLLLAVILWLLVRKGPPLATVAVRGLYAVAHQAHGIALAADYALHAFRRHRDSARMELVSDGKTEAPHPPPSVQPSASFSPQWRN